MIEEQEEIKTHISLHSTDYTLLFVIISLSLAIICREIYLRIKLPYTPVIVIIGGFFGGFTVFG